MSNYHHAWLQGFHVHILLVGCFCLLSLREPFSRSRRSEAARGGPDVMQLCSFLGWQIPYCQVRFWWFWLERLQLFLSFCSFMFMCLFPYPLRFHIVFKWFFGLNMCQPLLFQAEHLAPVRFLDKSVWPPISCFLVSDTRYICFVLFAGYQIKLDYIIIKLLIWSCGTEILRKSLCRYQEKQTHARIRDASGSQSFSLKP